MGSKAKRGDDLGITNNEASTDVGNSTIISPKSFGLTRERPQTAITNRSTVTLQRLELKKTQSITQLKANSFAQTTKMAHSAKILPASHSKKSLPHFTIGFSSAKPRKTKQEYTRSFGMLAAYGEYDKFMKAMKSSPTDLNAQIKCLKRKRRQRQKQQKQTGRASPEFSRNEAGGIEAVQVEIAQEASV